MEINVKTITNLTHTFEVEPTETVDNLWVRLEGRKGIPSDKQRFVFGKQLLSGHTLAEYGIQNGSTIHMVLHLRGGP